MKRRTMKSMIGNAIILAVTIGAIIITMSWTPASAKDVCIHAVDGQSVVSYSEDVDRLSEFGVYEAERYVGNAARAVAKRFETIGIGPGIQEFVETVVIWTRDPRREGNTRLALVVYDKNECYLDVVEGNWNSWKWHKRFIFKDVGGENA